MTMLKTFNLKGNKLSFADWISNLSPTETPFVSMISKEKVDQTQYSWQTDRLAQPGKHGSAANSVNPDTDDTDLTAIKEGSAAVSNYLHQTKVHTNFTQIFRKAVRVTDTTKKISLYGRNSEFSYQMEKAGLEIKRDLEFAILNSTEKGRLGTADKHGVFDGFQNLVAPVGAKCYDTGAIVHKAVTYTAAAAGTRQVYFTKEQVFDLTLQLYIAGSRPNKIMFHPMHMSQFSDWVSDTSGGTSGAYPHLHRMFDGLETKYNAVVKKIRDPLGQEFTLIPNRHMPKDMLFFFNEADWTQMVLREPQKTTLAKMGSSEKQMIEFEVGLRHRNPFASGILRFTETAKKSVDIQIVNPQNLEANNTKTATVKAVVRGADGAPGTAAETVTFTAATEDGTNVPFEQTAAQAPAADDSFGAGAFVATNTIKVPTAQKGKRIKVKAVVNDASTLSGTDTAVLDAYESRD